MSERRKYEINPSFADLFTTQEDRDDAKLERVQMLPLGDLKPFPDHPFEVRDDEEMEKLVDSIRVHGVLMPAIARERPDGSYELVAGHRRKRACELAGLQELPVLVREMDDDTATILMVDSNVQREHVLPSEKAKAYKMKLDAIKRKSGRPSKENSCQVGTNFLQGRSDEALAESTSESARTVQRYEEQRKMTLQLARSDARLEKYRTTAEMQETLRKERHELKNRYFYIQTLVRQNKLDELEKYLETITKDDLTNLNQVDTGNVLLDYLLNHELREARQRKIPTVVEVVLSAQLALDEHALCTVLLNLLDNAIEASTCQPGAL